MIIDKVRAQLLYLLGLREYLGETIDLEDARRGVAEELATGTASFLDLVERGVFGNPQSPYRPLLDHAGIGMNDLARLVSERGLKGALGSLHDAGVYLTIEEARGRVPVRRPGLEEFVISRSDLNNPLLTSYYEGVSSGSRSGGTPVWIDFAQLKLETRYVSCLLAAHGVRDNPIGVWRPVPPDITGFSAMFRYTRAGKRPVRWFSQAPVDRRSMGPKQALFLRSTLLVSRLCGQPFPAPEFVPPEQALTVARWLAEQQAMDMPAMLDTSASGATRVCLAAKEHGLDIAGTIMRVGGEPYTPAKARVIEAAGVHVFDRYSMSELGIIGLGCGTPQELDDLHIVTGKLAVTTHEKQMDDLGTTVAALTYTTLRPTCSTVLINTESGDYGTLEERHCGCLLDEIGLSTHLSGLRSYEKLTSEGVTFMSHDLYQLLEETLPARFGGHATDYQLVEEEVDGLPRVSLVVGRAVGPVDEDALVEAVLEALDNNVVANGERRVDGWRRAHTLAVLRREPYASGSRKILPLHILKAPAPSNQQN